jgi:polysaccharide deacetylase family protein (PEP-CTERM system associated)
VQGHNAKLIAVSGAMSHPAITPSILSVDVEDWFHILDVASEPPLETWHTLETRVEKNFRRLLELFAQHHARATCFFLGWVGERFPHLVREAVSGGHEIASHGYAHKLVYRMTCAEFQADAQRSKKILEDISGAPVAGYRSAGFSVTEKTAWFFEALTAAGYQYDSSVFPAARSHGGMPTARREPHHIKAGLIEFPMTVTDLLGQPLCFFGGGYLRLFPYALIHRMARRVLAEGRPVIYYIHPREIDPAHPRLPMSAARRFKSYVNLRSTEAKLGRILAEFPAGTFRDFLAARADMLEVAHAD